MRSRIERLLRPVSIAVVGATERPGYAARLLANLVAGGYAGRIVPVNRMRATVAGLAAFPSITAVPVGPIDVALVVVPADDVGGVVLECGVRGVAAVVVITAGFGEAGPEGRARRDRLQAAARRTGVWVLGPNGNGYASATAGVWATTFSGLRPAEAKPALPVALLSQSGGTAFGAGHERAQDLGFSFDVVVSTGNEEVVTSEHLAGELLAGGTEVVALVAEELRDGPALLRAARIARERERSLVVLKIGRSEAGRAAAATHTGALAGDDAVIDGVLRQHGIVRVDDVDDLVTCVRFLASAPRPRGRRAIVLSHSGGLGALAADALGREGFELPPLAAATRERLDDLLGPVGGRGNPADITMALREEVVSDVVAALLAEDPDVLEVVTAGDPALPARVAVGATEASAPVALVWTSGLRSAGPLTELDVSPVPWFPTTTGAARVLARCRDAAHGDTPELAAARRAPAGSARTLDEVEGKRWLRDIGLCVPEAVVTDDIEQLLRAAADLPAPWVLKVVSPKVLHKAASGLLALGIEDVEALRRAADRLATRAAHLGGHRFLLERQHAVRAELYLGCTVDPHVGPVVGIGIGGGDVELTAAVVWSTCPLDEARALRVLADERLGALLSARGVSSSSALLVAAAAARLSRAFADQPLHEVEINPLAVDDGGTVLALDAVLRVDMTEGVAHG